LGAALNWAPAFEVGCRSSTSDVDVVFNDGEGHDLQVEVSVLSVSDPTSAAEVSSRALVSFELSCHALEQGVSITGRLLEEPTAGDAARVPNRIRELIDLVAADERQRSLSLLGGLLVFRYAGILATWPVVSWPFDAHLDPRRLHSRLRNKVEQANKSGARWLRLDWEDQHWQFSDWSQASLPTKAVRIKSDVKQELDHGNCLDGVIVTSGALLGGDRLADEQVGLADGTVAIRKHIYLGRFRESVVIPLTLRGRDELGSFVDMARVETSWLPGALERVGLPSLDPFIRSPMQLPPHPTSS
jgi:hypothetical protein